MAQLKKILSIDGGGIRGILPAMLLAEFERRTEKPAAELFDLIAGTSTGGIISLAVSLQDETGQPKYNAQNLVDLYGEHGERIFSRTKLHKLQSIGNLTGVKYPSDGMEEVFSTFFGDAMLSEASIDTLITAYDIERQRPLFFKSSEARNDPGSDFLMRDVAHATSAAPTYFEPYKLNTSEPEEYYALVDGLVFAGNPAMCAYAEVQGESVKNENILMVSLGTGKAIHRRMYQDVKDWGALKWSENIMDIVLHGVILTVHHQMKKILPPRKNFQRYYRFQAQLDEQSVKMDDITPANIRSLKLLAEDVIAEKSSEIDRLCEALTK